MKDSRMVKLAKQLVNYSCDVKKGEKVLIEITGNHTDFVVELVKEVYAVGGLPFVKINDTKIQRALLMGAIDEQMDFMASIESARMKGMQAYIGIRADENAYELCDVPSEKTKIYMSRYSQKVHGQIRVPDTKWVVLRYPCPAMAQQAKMSQEAFEDFYFNVCTVDYGKMSKAMDSLVKRMQATKHVKITGRETNLEFDINGLPAIKCDGKLNVPDGEVYTAPVKNSVNGKITYNTPSLYMGKVYNDISLTFKDGKIIDAVSSDNEGINAILDTDEGARYIGEFAIGVNPYMLNAIMDTLFDEKIMGSIHFTPGNAYDDCDNTNRSAVHWDLVFIQTPEYGGGTIEFDGEVIRKDGLFVVDDLECLNPDNLK